MYNFVRKKVLKSKSFRKFMELSYDLERRRSNYVRKLYEEELVGRSRNILPCVFFKLLETYKSLIYMK